MKLKFKLVSAACVALCSAGAFAALPPIVCAPTTLSGLINTCAPEVTFYMGGASAQGGALNAVLAAGAGIFDTAAIRGKISDTSAAISGLNGGSDVTKTSTVGYIGFGAAGTTYAGKRVLVIYNKANGSMAGVNQLLTGKGGALEEVTLVTSTVKNLAKGIAGTCVAVEPATAGALGTASCATELAFKSGWGADAVPQKKMHLALADVRPNEATPGVVKKWDSVKFPATVTGMQGFGVIVNPALYTKLIAAEVAAGRLASSCLTSEVVGGATDVITAACQPNLSKALYASVVTGQINTANALLSTTGDATKLVLARRVSQSGTQPASNIFFAGQAGYAVKTPLVDGYAAVLGAGVVGDLTVSENSTTGDVITAVSGNTTDYAMGVASLENTYSMTKSASKVKGALFVKLENVSPNFDAATGALDSKHRVGLQAGYPFAFDMQAVKQAALAGDYLDIADKVIAALIDPAQNLAGIAYIGSADASKNTSYTHGVSNYLPLTKN